MDGNEKKEKKKKSKSKEDPSDRSEASSAKEKKPELAATPKDAKVPWDPLAQLTKEDERKAFAKDAFDFFGFLRAHFS